MRIVVTGGAGFIGSHLIEALVTRGDEVLCVERPDASLRWLEGLPIEVAPIGVRDVGRLAAAFEGAKVVYHLAGLTEARSAAEFYAVNTEGTRHVLEAAARLAPSPPRVILLSSLAAIGPCRNGEALSPDSVPCPLSHYGQSKLLAEAMVHAFADRVPATVLRFPAVYGPRERGVLTFFRMVRWGVAFTPGSWNREVSMLYVKDAIQAILAAGTGKRAAGRTYCVAHPTPVSWTAFATAVGRALGRDPVRLSVPVPVARLVAMAAELGARLQRRAAILNREKMRELLQARWVCDPSRAIAELGFRPEFAVERGTAETAAWYREAAWL
ncbi:MAG: NAD-dependent epimerase/dehydratase family protein [Gemmatimonadales bacterium]